MLLTSLCSAPDWQGGSCSYESSSPMNAPLLNLGLLCDTAYVLFPSPVSFSVFRMFIKNRTSESTFLLLWLGLQADSSGTGLASMDTTFGPQAKLLRRSAATKHHMYDLRVLM